MSATAHVSYSQIAWVGSEDQLRRLVAIADRFLESERRKAFEEFDAQTNTEIADGVKQLESLWGDRLEDDRKDARIREIQARRVERRALLEANWNTRLWAYEPEYETRTEGEAAAIFEHLDRRAIHMFGFTSPGGLLTLSKRSVTVTLSRSSGARVEMKGPDRGSVASCQAEFRTELRRGRPWWFRLKASVTCAVVAALGLLILILLAIPRVNSSISRSVSTPVYLVGVVAAQWYWLMNLLPAFEIIEPGERGRSDRAIAMVASPLVAFGLGILVNHIS